MHMSDMSTSIERGVAPSLTASSIRQEDTLPVTCAYTYDQLLRYTDAEDARWRDWLSQNPAALDVPFAEGRLSTIRGLVTHIFAVELRYTERLLGRDVTSYDDIHANSLDEIFALGARARL